MLAQSASYAAYQRARFMRPDAVRYVRPDAARWLKPDAARYLRPGTNPTNIFPALDRKYNPNQPRVPEGNPEGGRWTIEGGSSWIAQPTQAKPRQNDPRVLSDADPDVVKPGQQYAQARGRGGGTVLINGQQFQLTPGQAARFEAARARAEESIARVREYEHNWKPPASTDGTPEGRIRSYQADTEAAQARIQWLTENRALPGPFCPEPMEARGPGRSYTLEERRQGNRLGDKYGCNSCGTRDPGTVSGNWVLDHHKPNALNTRGEPQRLYPQCLSCSKKQGGFVSYLVRENRRNETIDTPRATKFDILP